MIILQIAHKKSQIGTVKKHSKHSANNKGKNRKAEEKIEIISGMDIALVR
ncbi:hypothetical protein [Chryseobacterium carnipullorum]|uniref:Uncharacterized protein n=1 Tax=Chryseobacterium carnipullorum TaxID=1124835 RepID=A0A376C232_CHRCU|nr:hypothetical protein [Chryseobacterium carnipullorum]STA51373.1 Uncharacterised protein [Chryseobacterium carnipullorum]